MKTRIEKLTDKIQKKSFPLCTEKARLITESFKTTEAEPPILRYAKAYAYILENIPVLIDSDELIVGEGASKPWGAELDPFLGLWKEDDIKGAVEDEIVSVEEREWPVIREVGKYWETRCAEYTQSKLFDDRLFGFLQLGITLPPMKTKDEFRGAYAGSGLCLSFNFTDCYSDFERWMNGLDSIILEAEDEMRALKLLDQDAVEKKYFLESVIIVLKAVVRLAERYADAAEGLAAEEKDPQRKKELERIAEACRWVPANRPRNFREAIQSLWINQILFTPASTTNLGRFDQYMYPFYRNDIDEGKITDEEVLELLCELRIKCMKPENIKLSGSKRSQHVGFAKWRNMTIGGVKADGTDATNELTYLVLEAANRLRLTHHTISMRIHEKTPEALMVKALEVVKTGIGMPAFALDKSFIDYMTSGGVPVEEARNYHLAGCLDPAIPGKASFLGGGFFVVPKVLEIFMNGGTDSKTGRDVGPYKISVEELKTFDEFYARFKDFLAHFMGIWHEHSALIAYSRRLVRYYDAVEILETALMHDGIKMGKPVSVREAVPPYDFRAIMVPVGTVNVIDSLAAVKKLVFDEKKISMKELRQALAQNFEGNGNGEARRMCLQAPKYGNDDDYVDSIARDLYAFIIGEEAKYKTAQRPVGGKIKGVGGASISSMWAGGAITGATPDGRLAGTTLADGTVSPSQGKDTNGPTALFKSAAKIDQASCSSALLNVKLHSSALAKTEDLKKLGMLIETYADMGGKWVQFNVVGKEKLLDAQKTPEDFKDLVVRVAGYSAYFVDLGKGVQDDIIRRTEVSLAGPKM
jgi:pyruvate formate-lyase/glycerol dehydratase family glycyl radical enzyme